MSLVVLIEDFETMEIFDETQENPPTVLLFNLCSLMLPDDVFQAFTKDYTTLMLSLYTSY